MWVGEVYTELSDHNARSQVGAEGAQGSSVVYTYRTVGSGGTLGTSVRLSGSFGPGVRGGGVVLCRSATKWCFAVAVNHTTTLAVMSTTIGSPDTPIYNLA